MKSILLLLMTASAFLFDATDLPLNNQGLQMQIESDIVFEKKVIIYGYDGELLKEFSLNDVANNELSVADHISLEASDFAFDFNGDYYYFGDQKELAVAIN